MKRGYALRLAPLVAAGLAGGCTVGSGTGSAVGTLQDVGCNGDNSYLNEKPYSLNPSFFAGEPIEDVCPAPPGKCSGPRMNRLLIRMQHTGNRVEANDTLYFDVTSSFKVAQCVRGWIKDGVPQWDQRLVTGSDGQTIPGLPWCDWTSSSTVVNCPNGGGADGGAADAGGPDGGGPPGGLPVVGRRARINLSTEDFVTASLAPLYSCVEARAVGVAVPPGSWIEFQSFGQAARPCVPPADRGQIADDFKVDFGQALTATFHLVLGDQTVQHAIKEHDAIPDTRINGVLDGSFDFDLDRGRAAQPFP